MTPLPDYPPTKEELEQEHAVNLMRGVVANVPDVNIMLDGTVLLSTRGAYSFCVGTAKPDFFLKIGFKA